MTKKVLPFAAALMLAGCVSSGAPSVEAPGLPRERIDLRFNFPVGSVCQVSTSQGIVAQSQMPGEIHFAVSDRFAPASCRLPDGRNVAVTAHNSVPADTRVAGITVYPDGRAFITASTASGLVQFQPFNTVQPM